MNEKLEFMTKFSRDLVLSDANFFLRNIDRSTNIRLETKSEDDVVFMSSHMLCTKHG